MATVVAGSTPAEGFTAGGAKAPPASMGLSWGNSSACTTQALLFLRLRSSRQGSGSAPPATDHSAAAETRHTTWPFQPLHLTVGPHAYLLLWLRLCLNWRSANQIVKAFYGRLGFISPLYNAPTRAAGPQHPPPDYSSRLKHD